MNKLTFDLSSSMVELKTGISTDLPIENDLLVTDKPTAAKRSAVPTVFIPDQLSAVAQVMCPRQVQAVLVPSHVRAPQLIAVADGCSVYSKLRALDLSLDLVTWEIVRRRAHGEHVEHIGSLVGYSARQVIRICDELRKDAGFGDEFTWQTLTPVFPWPESG